MESTQLNNNNDNSLVHQQQQQQHRRRHLPARITNISRDGYCERIDVGGNGGRKRPTDPYSMLYNNGSNSSHSKNDKIIKNFNGDGGKLGKNKFYKFVKKMLRRTDAGGKRNSGFSLLQVRVFYFFATFFSSSSSTSSSIIMLW